MIKTSGANVAPREVEAAIHDVTGLTAHVVGHRRCRPRPGRRRSHPGACGPDVDTEALRVQLRERLSAYKVPRQILLLRDDEVPMMSSGKLDLRALKDLFGD